MRSTSKKSGMPRLTDYSVWIFECDGTLIDRQGGARVAKPGASPAGRRAPQPDRCDAGSAASSPVFPDAATALLYLQKYVRLVAATEAEPDLFVESGKRLGVRFDSVVTLECDGRSDVERTVRLHSALSSLSVEGREILFVAGGPSEASRIVHRLGMALCRIDRGLRVGFPPATEADCEFGFANLAELVIAHQDAVRAP